jgi:hypothetical protein
MPNVRGANQTLISCPMDADLLSEIDGKRGRKSRSQFIREALAEKLKSLGIAVPDSLIYPPDRVSKKVKIKQTGGGSIHVGDVNIAPKSKSTSTTTARAGGGAGKKMSKKAGGK